MAGSPMKKSKNRQLIFFIIITFQEQVYSKGSQGSSDADYSDIIDNRQQGRCTPKEFLGPCQTTDGTDVHPPASQNVDARVKNKEECLAACHKIDKAIGCMFSNTGRITCRWYDPSTQVVRGGANAKSRCWIHSICEDEVLTARSSGKCTTQATETECANGVYPSPSYKYIKAGSWSHTPAGCYVYPSSSSKYPNKVYFNRGGTTCKSNPQCLCKSPGGAITTIPSKSRGGYCPEFEIVDGAGGTEVTISDSLTGLECINACKKQKETDQSINGITVLKDGGGGCWCEQNMDSVSKSAYSTQRYLTCRLTQAAVSQSNRGTSELTTTKAVMTTATTLEPDTPGTTFDTIDPNPATTRNGDTNPATTPFFNRNPVTTFNPGTDFDRAPVAEMETNSILAKTTPSNFGTSTDEGKSISRESAMNERSTPRWSITLIPTSTSLTSHPSLIRKTPIDQVHPFPSVPYNCYLASGSGVGGTEVWAGEKTEDECVSTCVERKEKENPQHISGVKVYSSSKKGCWCKINMTSVVESLEFKTCFISNRGNAFN